MSLMQFVEAPGRGGVARRRAEVERDISQGTKRFRRREVQPREEERRREAREVGTAR